MSKTKQTIPPVLKTPIHDIQPVLELEGEFRARDVPLDPETTHGVLLHLRRQGYVEQLDRVGDRSDDPDALQGDKAHRYRWVDDAKPEFEYHLNTLDTLPCCGGRKHVPDSRDLPEGQVACKFCGRKYGREHFAEILGDWP